MYHVIVASSINAPFAYQLTFSTRKAAEECIAHLKTRDLNGHLIEDTPAK